MVARPRPRATLGAASLEFPAGFSCSANILEQSHNTVFYLFTKNLDLTLDLISCKSNLTLTIADSSIIRFVIQRNGDYTLRHVTIFVAIAYFLFV